MRAAKVDANQTAIVDALRGKAASTMGHVIADVSLPWPGRDLSPNSRVHWRRKSASVRAARELAWALVNRTGDIPPGPYRVEIDAIPPDARRRDVDNVLASCKAYLDGIFQRLGVDDGRVREVLVRRCDPDPVGSGVVIRVLEVDA